MTVIAAAVTDLDTVAPAEQEPRLGSKIVYLDGVSTVMKVCLRMQDRVCRSGAQCPARDFHALESFGRQVETMLDVIG